MKRSSEELLWEFTSFFLGHDRVFDRASHPFLRSGVLPRPESGIEFRCIISLLGVYTPASGKTKIHGMNDNPKAKKKLLTPYIVKARVFNKLKHSWTQHPTILHQKTGRFCSWLKGMHQWLLEWSWQNQEEKKRNIKTGRAHRNAIQVREATSQKSNRKMTTRQARRQSVPRVALRKRDKLEWFLSTSYLQFIKHVKWSSSNVYVFD